MNYSNQQSGGPGYRNHVTSMGNPMMMSNQMHNQMNPSNSMNNNPNNMNNNPNNMNQSMHPHHMNSHVNNMNQNMGSGSIVQKGMSPGGGGGGGGPMKGPSGGTSYPVVSVGQARTRPYHIPGSNVNHPQQQYPGAGGQKRGYNPASYQQQQQGGQQQPVHSQQNQTYPGNQVRQIV